jgi:hypothetical protein
MQALELVIFLGPLSKRPLDQPQQAGESGLLIALLGARRQLTDRVGQRMDYLPHAL